MHVSSLLRARGRLATDKSGVAIIEFAYGFPILLFMSAYGLEVGNLALTNMRISQAALNLADNASRVGMDSGLPVVQLREVDINDVLAGAKKFGHSFQLAEKGRITVSSLYHNGTDQRIQWQRCLGLKKGVDWDSHYGTTGVNSLVDTRPENRGTLRPQGMGPAGEEVQAPPNLGLIFVEINYEYQPVIALSWIYQQRSRLHYTASYLVRDNRDFQQIYNPAPTATRYTCDRYTAE